MGDASNPKIAQIHNNNSITAKRSPAELFYAGRAFLAPRLHASDRKANFSATYYEG